MSPGGRGRNLVAFPVYRILFLCLSFHRFCLSHDLGLGAPRSDPPLLRLSPCPWEDTSFRLFSALP